MRRLPLGQAYRHVVIAVSAGFLVSVALLWISFITSIHDELRTAAFLFPVPVLLNPDLHSLNLGIVFLAVIQWPLYGLIIAWALSMRTKRLLLLLVVAFLIFQHIMVGFVARARVESVPVKMKLERDLPV